MVYFVAEFGFGFVLALWAHISSTIFSTITIFQPGLHNWIVTSNQMNNLTEVPVTITIRGYRSTKGEAISCNNEDNINQNLYHFSIFNTFVPKHEYSFTYFLGEQPVNVLVVTNEMEIVLKSI